MISKDRPVNIFVALLTPIAVAVVVWAIRGVTPEHINVGVVTLAALTIFCSCYLRIHLPRTNIHLTISDGLIILSMLLYGGGVALLLAVIETALASMKIRYDGAAIRPRTILINTYFAAISVFVAAKAVSFIFGSTELILHRDDLTSFVWLLALMAMSMFLVNSIFVAT